MRFFNVICGKRFGGVEILDRHGRRASELSPSVFLFPAYSGNGRPTSHSNNAPIAILHRAGWLAPGPGMVRDVTRRAF
jgi:hypothetical protein